MKISEVLKLGYEIHYQEPEGQESISDDKKRKRGPVIRLNNTFYVEISGSFVFEYNFKFNKWSMSRPIPVRKYEYNFPPNINAVFESIDEYIYFIRKDKYCKRKLKDKRSVSICFQITHKYVMQFIISVQTMGFFEQISWL